jgi:metal-responsive CopG/Arc/MetJ family transcriptional regulator
MPTKTHTPCTKRAIIPVSLRADLADALRDLATREDMPQSVLIRQAVRRMLQEAEVSPCR